MNDLLVQAAAREVLEQKLTRVVVDLQKCTWTPGEGEGGNSRLVYDDGQVKTDVRLSPLAFKQMCNRIVGGLYTIAEKNPSTLNKDMLAVWLPLTDEKKKLTTLKLEDRYCHGMVGVEQSDVDSSKMLKALGTALDGFKLTVMDLGKDGDYPDFLWKRVIVENKGVQSAVPGDEYRVMLDLKVSDWAVESMHLEFGLYRPLSGGAIIARANGREYFKNQYKGIQGKDLEAVAASAAGRMDAMVQSFSGYLRTAELQNLTEEEVRQLVKQLPRDRGTSKGIMTKVAGDVEARKPKTLMEVVNIISTAVNAEEHCGRRIQHESFAGTLMGLEFAAR